MDGVSKKYKILIIHDNFEPHRATQTVDAAREMNMTLFCLPPNSTFVSQPLDVCINRPLKECLRKLFNKHLVQTKWDGSSFDVVTKEMITNWIKCVWCDDEQIKPKTIAKSFRVCGLGVSPASDEPIYWNSLHSLQQELSTSRLPSVQDLFGDILSSPDTTRPVVMYFPRAE